MSHLEPIWRKHGLSSCSTAGRIPDRQVAQLLELQPPHTIHQVTTLIEKIMRHHAKVDAPQLASLIISRVRGGIPAPGFFMLLEELGLYEGSVDGEDARHFHAHEMQRIFEAV